MKRFSLLVVLCTLLAACGVHSPVPYDVRPDEPLSSASNDSTTQDTAHAPVAEESHIQVSGNDEPATLETRHAEAPHQSINAATLLTLTFDTGSGRLDDASLRQLRDVGELLAAQGDLAVSIEGHTDSVGSEAANQALSERRARAVSQHLTREYDVAPERMAVLGKGEADPVADNATPQGRARNRRVLLAVRSLGPDTMDNAEETPLVYSLTPDGPPVAAAPLNRDRDSLEDAGRRALAVGEYQQAYAIYGELLKIAPEDPDVNFNMGQAMFGMGNYPLALFYYERILDWDPSADRVRLEAAMTYMAMGQPEDARREFETVLAHDPPPQVRENIEAHLARLDESRRRTEVTGSVQTGVTWDSNVNAGPSDPNVETLLGTIILDESAMPEGGWGLMGAANVNVSHRLGDESPWYLTAMSSHYRIEYLQYGEYDMATTRGGGGVRYASGRHAAQVQLRYQDVDFGGHDLMDIVGGNVTYLYALTPRTHLIADQILERRDHLVNNERDSYYRSTGGYVRFMIDDQGSSLLLGGRVFRDDADEAKYTSQGFEFSGQCKVVLPHELTATLGLAYKDIMFEAPPSTLISYNRHDHQVRLSTSLKKGIWEGLSVQVSGEIMENSSNFEAFSYEKALCTFSLIYEF